MDVWSWICELPDSVEWNAGANSLNFELASNSRAAHQEFIQLRAERTFEPADDDVSEANSSLSFSLEFHSSSNDNPNEVLILWVSEKCNLSQKNHPFLPLVLQLLQETISRAPNAQDCATTCPRSQLQKLKSKPISWILDSHSQESFSSFFNLIFLTRLFWLCLFEAPTEVGSLYFHSLLTPNLQTFSCNHAPVLRTFFVSVGTDVELCFMRTFGYMLAKALLFRDMGVNTTVLKALPLTGKQPAPARSDDNTLGVSYATESHGMWILKGYIPVNSMSCVLSSRPNVNQELQQSFLFPLVEPKESVLKYTLAHQQLEAVIQMEYRVVFCDGFIQVQAMVDNIRLHVVKLGFKNKQGDPENDGLMKEMHFPSRVRVWVGPEVGANYVGSLSLGRSTENTETEVEMQKILKGSYGKLKFPKVKGTARMATKARIKNWRWDQDVEGNAAVFDGILCDNTTGVEIATWKPPGGAGGRGAASGDNHHLVVNSFSRRYSGGNRAFTKNGGVVFAGEEFGGGENGGGVGWRLSKDMEGSVLKWRIGAQVWLSYWPHDISSSYYETRCVEWCDEVDLPLIPAKYA